MIMVRARHFISPIVWSLLAVAGLTVLLVMNATAREVAVEAFQWVFGVFTTPFIFEATCALIFLCALLVYNQWRLRKEGDGWVYLVSEEPDEELPAKITQRLQSVVLTHKPEVLDAAQAEAGVIEGYLELGMPSQALAELNSDRTQHSVIEAASLRIRVLAANLDNEAAFTLLRQTSSAHPELRPALATVAVENARWLLKHLHREDIARTWLREARKLDAAALDSIDSGEPLRRLA